MTLDHIRQRLIPASKLRNRLGEQLQIGAVNDALVSENLNEPERQRRI